MRFTVPRPTVLVVNYPSNPTAEVVDLAFYERLVAWAKENDLGPLRPRLFGALFRRQADAVDPAGRGAKDVAVEFTSMSKTFSMAGWRIGFAVGNRG